MNKVKDTETDKLSNVVSDFMSFVQLSVMSIPCIWLYFAKDTSELAIREYGVKILVGYFLCALITSKLAIGYFKIELLYVLYLPFMLSFAFNPTVIIINSILAFNVFNTYLEVPYFLPVQFLVYYMNNKEIEFDTFCIAVGINYILSIFFKKVGQLRSLDHEICNIFSILLTNIFYLTDTFNMSIPFKILHGTLSALICVILINYIILKLIGNLFKSHPYIQSTILSSIIVLGFPLLTDHFIQIHDSMTPLQWLINYITSSEVRLKIFFTWLIVVATLVPTFVMLQSHLSLNTSRKVWHFLIFLMITIPFKYDSKFVKIALAGIIPLFLCIEYIRFLKLDPVGSYLDSTLRSFADERDLQGPLIISYIYLILGISFPLFLYDSPVGLISLGVGDSLASIVGKKFGRYRWPDSEKTIEGTIAFTGSTFVVCEILKISLNYFENTNWYKLLIICFLSGILEGNSILNDNILIPSYMLICERLQNFCY